MEEFILSANRRSETGKEYSNRLRFNGYVPAIVYGGDHPSEMISVELKELDKMLHRIAGETILITLKVKDLEGEGQKEDKILLKSVQRDPVSSKIMHVDFYRVSLSKPMRLEVPIHGVGTPEGVKSGGILEHHARTVEVKCLPLKMPRFIEVDLANLAINHSIHVSDLKVGEGVEILSDSETVLFTVLPPKIEEIPVPEVAEEEAEAVAEPEMVKKEKEEEPVEGEKKERGEKKEETEKK